MDHVDISSDDDPALYDCGVGAILHLKGKLENVRWGKDPRFGRHRATAPSVVVTFADWSMLTAEINGYDYAEAFAKAKAITIPLSTYVCVKAQVINEDAELRALAIWPLDSCVPIPLGEPIHV